MCYFIDSAVSSLITNKAVEQNVTVFLYNLRMDPSEQFNLVDVMPGVAMEMLTKLKGYQSTSLPAHRPQLDQRYVYSWGFFSIYEYFLTKLRTCLFQISFWIMLIYQQINIAYAPNFMCCRCNPRLNNGFWGPYINTSRSQQQTPFMQRLKQRNRFIATTPRTSNGRDTGIHRGSDSDQPSSGDTSSRKRPSNNRGRNRNNIFIQDRESA